MRKMLLAALGVVLVVADNRERVSPGERSQSGYVETQRGEVYIQSRSATPKSLYPSDTSRNAAEEAWFQRRRTDAACRNADPAGGVELDFIRGGRRVTRDVRLPVQPVTSER